MIDQTVVEELLKRGERTPDFSDIRKKNLHFVFLYDELHTFHDSQDIMKDFKNLGQGMTANPIFDMKNRVRTDTPIVFKAKKKDRSRTVKGNIWAVSPKDILTLDKFYENGEIHYRERRSIRTLDQKFESSKGDMLSPTLPCWIYLARPAYFEGMILKDESEISVGKRAYYKYFNTDDFKPHRSQNYNYPYGSQNEMFGWAD